MTTLFSQSSCFSVKGVWHSPSTTLSPRDRNCRSRALLADSAAAITAYLASSSVDWNRYIPASTLLFFVLGAVAAGSARRSDQKEPSISG
jgi:hypothetical protein